MNRSRGRRAARLRMRHEDLAQRVLRLVDTDGPMDGIDAAVLALMERIAVDQRGTDALMMDIWRRDRRLKALEAARAPKEIVARYCRELIALATAYMAADRRLGERK